MGPWIVARKFQNNFLPEMYGPFTSKQEAEDWPTQKIRRQWDLEVIELNAWAKVRKNLTPLP